MTTRQALLLRLLAAFDGSLDALDFQKLLFLYVQDVEAPGAPSYEFVPYKFGGFSYTSYADKRKLIADGLLADEDRVWRLTDLGRAQVGPTGPSLQAFRMRFDKVRGNDLVRVAYREHPYYATGSEIAERVLAGDPPALHAIEAARPPRGYPGLCTIGYEGKSVEGYINALLRDGVTLLCDVRRNPLSRKYGFAKATLSKAVEGVGIRYAHLPELGIASDERQHLRVQADYDRLFAKYRRDDLPQQAAHVARIRDWIAAGERVALTCYEAVPGQCHRHCVADAVVLGQHGAAIVKHL